MKDNQYPDGKLSPEDQGEIATEFAADHENSLIHMRFKTPVVWAAFPPAIARDLARKILDMASEVENKGQIVMWAIFNSPADHPGKYVGRKFIGTGPCNQMIVKDTLEQVREALPIGTLVRLERMEGDVPSLVETWI